MLGSSGRRYVLVAIVNHPNADAARPALDALVQWTMRRHRAARPEREPMTDWVGYLAATLTTASFVPQVWLTFRTRNVAGISLGMYAVFTLGTALWLA